MSLSKFVACLILFELHLGHGVAELSQQHRQGRDNSSSPSDFHFLITGGYRPETNELVKYVVSVRLGDTRKYFGDNHNCGGTIISKRAILTAAHCMYGDKRQHQARKITIVAGTPRRLQEEETTQVRKVKKLVPHPKYRKLPSGAPKHDLGIVLLKEELNTGDAVAIISLNDKSPSAGLQCTSVGWGTVVQWGPLPDEVINGDLKVLPTSECKKMKAVMEKGMICAKNTNDYEVDTCQGDSGGPLICGNMITGIVSFGAGCGEPDTAGVYTDVYYYREWIQENSAHQLGCRVAMLLLLLLLLLAATAA